MFYWSSCCLRGRGEYWIDANYVGQVIDIPKETFRLGGASAGIDPNAVQDQISTSAPRYAFYHYPDSEAVVFIYTCPSGSSIKERMLYASSRLYALQVAEDQGLKISKKVRNCQSGATID